MNKLEKSIRHELNYYGPRLRTGHYGVVHHSAGLVPSDFRHIKKVCCDVEDGIVTDIRLYCVGDAQERDDYYGDTTDITTPIEDYLKGELDWDHMIWVIADICKGDASAAE